MSLLNTPIQINRLLLPNRLVMPPMATYKAGDAGEVTPPLCAYYDEKSRGGYIGLIITEHSCVSPEGKAKEGQMSIAEDRLIAGYEKLVSSVQKNGTSIMAQISHAGGSAHPTAAGARILSASHVEMPQAGAADSLPEEMTVSEIERVAGDFAKAAVRAKKAGYDGVEIHAAHGYLLNQFYSPLTNRRTDAYNGSTIQGRIRFHLDVIRAVRSAVGADYPVALRFGACDYMEGGTTIEDSIAAAKELEKAGIDFLDISGGLCMYRNPNSDEPGYFAELSEKIKEQVSIPVLLTGGITQAQTAESLLEEKKADLIGVGRAILGDSAWAKKAMELLA